MTDAPERIWAWERLFPSAERTWTSGTSGKFGTCPNGDGTWAGNEYIRADLAATRAALAEAQGEVERLRGEINALYHVVGEMDHAVSHLPSQRKLDRKAVLAAVSDCKSAALKGNTP